jgi:hypothetical protein
MRIAVASVILAAAGAGPAASAPPIAVEIKDAVAFVTVVPEDRADVQVEILTRRANLPLKVKTGRRTIIDGDLRPQRIRGCRTANGEAVVDVARLGRVGVNDMPHVLVRTPRNVAVSAGGAVYGVIGRAASVDLGNAGCGDWTVANVEQELKVSLAGSGNARAGTSGAAKLRVAGAGDIRTGAVRGPVDVDVAGAGDVDVGGVRGELDVNVAGSGDVRIHGGQAPVMKVTIAGSGSVSFGGSAGSLNARIAGSGDVRARQVRGRVQKTVVGSGGVIVG